MANYQLKTLLLLIIFFIKVNYIYAQFENSEHYQIYAINLPEKRVDRLTPTSDNCHFHFFL